MLVALMLAGAGCISCKQAPAPETASAADPGVPTRAQPRLQTLKLWLGAEEMITELALSGEEQQTGMMFRTNMAENEGMLFVFSRPHQASFWMKNTILPLSAAYIDAEGVILEIHNLEPHNTNSVTASSDRVQFVLETRQGWFQRHHVREGMAIRTERGPLLDTFFGKR
jgi:uncharacterized membrane protein (UPF0127 family)